MSVLNEKVEFFVNSWSTEVDPGFPKEGSTAHVDSLFGLDYTILPNCVVSTHVLQQHMNLYYVASSTNTIMRLVLCNENIHICLMHIMLLIVGLWR